MKTLLIMIIAGSGTREVVTDKLLFDKVLGQVVTIFQRENPTSIISGMAEGFDEIVARAAISLKIPFMAFIPNSGYLNYYWGKNSKTGRDRLAIAEKILSYASDVKYICQSVYQDGLHANFHRNHAMVDAADKLLVYVSSSSGTKECVAYAKSRGKPIITV